MSTSVPQRSRWLLKLMLAVMASVIALFLGEAFIRVFGNTPELKAMWVSRKQSAYQRSENPLLSIELKPNFRDPEADLRHSYRAINAHGLRDRERSVEKVPGVRRVLLLGDSIVEGHGLAFPETIGAQWEKLESSGHTEVFNFGVSGYVTLSEVELLETRGVKFRPDVVVLIFIENDYNNFVVEFMPMGAMVDRPTWAKHLFVNSHLFRKLAIEANLFGFGTDADPLSRNHAALGGNNVVDGLARLRAMSEEHGFDVVIAIWPRFENDAVIDPAPMPDSNVPIVERLATMFGFPSTRLSVGFRKHREANGVANPRMTYSSGDGMHPSPVGAAVAASVLRGWVETRGETSGRFETSRGLPAMREDAAAVAAAAALGMAEPNYASVHSNYGRTLLQAGRIEEALAALDRAVQLDPRSRIAYYNRGLARLRSGMADAALTDFDRAIALGPDFMEAYSDRGIVHWQMRRFEAARADFDKAIELDPDHPGSFNNRGVLRRDQGDYVGAREDFTEAIRLQPEFVGALHNRGVLLRRIGNPDDAVDDFSVIIALHPSRASAWSHRGVAHDAAGNRKLALHDLSRAIDLEPGSAYHHANRGNVNFSLGNVEASLADYNRATVLAPDFAEAVFRRGLCHLKQRRFREALADLLRAVALEPNSERFLIELAWLRATCPDDTVRDEAKAVEDATRAHALVGRHDARTFEVLAAAHAAFGDFGTAVKWQEKAAALFSDDAAKAQHERIKMYERGEAYQVDE